MSKGRYGRHGGQYIPETLMNAVLELERAYDYYKNEPQFMEELQALYREYANRPSLLYFAEKMTRDLGGAKIYLKREDLLHTGAHKINNALAQAILAMKMGKKRVVAETGAGQHGVACATVAALFGLECHVFMGEEDVRRQALNVFRMRLLGAKVIPVTSGTATLKDATSEAIRYWAANITDTYYIIGSVVGPHPYPMIVRDFQRIIGDELKEQAKEIGTAKLSHIVACLGGGSNAMGIFYPFKDDADVIKIGIEAAGRGNLPGDNAESLTKGRPGVLHGAYSYLLQDDDGQIIEAYSISAGLDYPGVGPEHAYFKDSGKVLYHSINDQEALAAFQLLAKLEGIIPAVESSHALAYLEKLMPQTNEDQAVVVCLSGRGDKDVQMVSETLKENL